MIQPRCPVCSTPVLGPTARCHRCCTPHHGDCWSFNGGCGIYACRGDRRVSAMPLAPDFDETRARVQAAMLTVLILFLGLGRSALASLILGR